MLKAQMAKVAGEDSTTWSHYVKDGIIEPPPENYRKMNLEELTDYIVMCKKDIELWRENNKTKEYPTRKRPKGNRAWPLPEYLRKAEEAMKNHQYGY